MPIGSGSVWSGVGHRILDLITLFPSPLSGHNAKVICLEWFRAISYSISASAEFPSALFNSFRGRSLPRLVPAAR